MQWLHCSYQTKDIKIQPKSSLIFETQINNSGLHMTFEIWWLNWERIIFWKSDYLMTIHVSIIINLIYFHTYIIIFYNFFDLNILTFRIQQLSALIVIMRQYLNKIESMIRAGSWRWETNYYSPFVWMVWFGNQSHSFWIKQQSR